MQTDPPPQFLGGSSQRNPVSPWVLLMLGGIGERWMSVGRFTSSAEAWQQVELLTQNLQGAYFDVVHESSLH